MRVWDRSRALCFQYTILESNVTFRWKILSLPNLWIIMQNPIFSLNEVPYKFRHAWSLIKKKKKTIALLIFCFYKCQILIFAHCKVNLQVYNNIISNYYLQTFIILNLLGFKKTIVLQSALCKFSTCRFEQQINTRHTHVRF